MDLSGIFVLFSGIRPQTGCMGSSWNHRWAEIIPPPARGLSSPQQAANAATTRLFSAPCDLSSIAADWKVRAPAFGRFRHIARVGAFGFILLLAGASGLAQSPKERIQEALQKTSHPNSAAE